MNASLVLKVFLIISFASMLNVGYPYTASAQQKVITLNYSNFFPAPHKISVLTEQWCKEIEARTNRRVKITYFPGGTLSPAAQTYENVIKGIADIGFSVFGYTRGRFPMISIMDNPLGYKSGIQVTRLINEFYKKFQPKELDDVHVLYLHAHGPGLLHTKRYVNKMEDLNGMKIRAQGTVVPIVQALGGAPVGTTMPQTYDALRTGVVDGAMSPQEALEGWKWGEIVKYTTQNFGSSYTATMFIVMNKQKWDSLPRDIQNIFTEVSAEWADKQGRLWDDLDRAGYQWAATKGHQVIALSREEDDRWASAVKPIYEKYVAEVQAKGLPGNEALNFCLDYLGHASRPSPTIAKIPQPPPAAAIEKTPQPTPPPPEPPKMTGPFLGKVIKIPNLDSVEVDLGSEHGIAVGNTGKVFYTISVGGQEKRIYVAKIVITHLSQKTAIARIEDKSGEIQPAYLVEVVR
jgi:TRAP-type transport system periplasmic protein